MAALVPIPVKPPPTPEQIAKRAAREAARLARQAPPVVPRALTPEERLERMRFGDERWLEGKIAQRSGAGNPMTAEEITQGREAIVSRHLE
jgi:hypothetical protein